MRTPSEVSLEIERDGGIQYIVRTGKPTLILERVKYFEDHRRAGEADDTFWESVATFCIRKMYPFHRLYDTDPDYK